MALCKIIRKCVVIFELLPRPRLNCTRAIKGSMAGYLDAIYGSENIDRNALEGCLVWDENLSKRMSASVYLQRMMDSYVAELADLGFYRSSDLGLYIKNLIGIHFESPIDARAYANVIIWQESIQIIIYVSGHVDERFTVNEFKLTHQDYMHKVQELHEAKLRLFGSLPQPIAEELAEYYSMVFHSH